MYTVSASDVRKGWSSAIDSVVRERPMFIKRTRDRMMLCSAETMAQIVGDLRYVADKYIEDDGSVTLSAAALDIVSNGDTLDAAISAFAADILEYAEEYYQNFELYNRAPNRKGHLPYVIKALTARSIDELEGAVVCRNGKI